MIAAFDVHYAADRASAAAVLFGDYHDVAPAVQFKQILTGVADYIPGKFFQRELPGILQLLSLIHHPPDEIIIDGYVRMGNRPGLGQHLFAALDQRIPVVGVAKSRFAGAGGSQVLRGKSTRPLYVTTVGVDLSAAAENIRRMHGRHRIPTLLKWVDLLARGLK
jgi:deoxyribonuclease V